MKQPPAPLRPSARGDGAGSTHASGKASGGLAAWKLPASLVIGLLACAVLLLWSQLAHLARLVPHDRATPGPKLALFYYLSGSDQTHIDNYMCARFRPQPFCLPRPLVRVRRSVVRAARRSGRSRAQARTWGRRVAVRHLLRGGVFGGEGTVAGCATARSTASAGTLPALTRRVEGAFRRYFLLHGIADETAGQQLDLYVLVDARARATLEQVLVTPASTAVSSWTYVIVPEACDKYDALRLAASYHSVRDRRYAAFMLLDSIARGPFQPSYAAGVPWTRAFVAGLGVGTRMVSSSIRCARRRGGAAAPAAPGTAGNDSASAGTVGGGGSYYAEDFAVAFDAAALNALHDVLSNVTCAERTADAALVARAWSRKLLAWVRCPSLSARLFLMALATSAF